MAEMYGSYSDEDLNEWQRMPQNIRVLTSSAFGAWLLRRDKRKEQESKTDKYEYHTDHTDCIWYGNDSGCPVTCSQYRDGWNDAMDYIYKGGKGYQPYRRK